MDIARIEKRAYWLRLLNSPFWFIYNNMPNPVFNWLYQKMISGNYKEYPDKTIRAKIANFLIARCRDYDNVEYRLLGGRTGVGSRKMNANVATNVEYNRMMFDFCRRKLK